MNFEITYWGQQASVVVSKVTFPRGKPTVANESVYADMLNYFPNDIEAKVVGASKWHYQAKRLKVTVVPVAVKPAPVEPPKTEPTVVAPVVVEAPAAVTVEVVPAPVEEFVFDPAATAEVVEPDATDLTLEERVSKLLPGVADDVVLQVVDALVSGGATQDLIVDLTNAKPKIAKRILKLVGG